MLNSFPSELLGKHGAVLARMLQFAPRAPGTATPPWAPCHFAGWETFYLAQSMVEFFNHYYCYYLLVVCFLVVFFFNLPPAPPPGILQTLRNKHLPSLSNKRCLHSGYFPPWRNKESLFDSKIKPRMEPSYVLLELSWYTEEPASFPRLKTLKNQNS